MSYRGLEAELWVRLKPWWPILPAVVLLSLAGAGWWAAHDRTHGRVFRMGYQQLPPAQLVDAAGGPTGAVVEALQVAAQRAGIRLEWVRVQDGPDAAFAAGKVDLWPIVAKLPAREHVIHISDPFFKVTYWIVSLEGTALPKGLAGLRVARGSASLTAKWSERLMPGVNFAVMSNQQTALEAACRGEVDAALVGEGMGDAVLLNKPAPCASKRLVLSALPYSEIWFGVGAERDDRGAVQAATRLRETIGQMTLDGRFASIALNWGLATGGEASTVYEYVEANRKERELRVALLVLLSALIVLAWQQKRLHKARAAAESASHAKSVFLANMSHEIRTPMNGVLGMAELMLRTPLSVEQRDYAETIWQSGHALLELINDILDLAKVEAGKMLLREAPFDPVDELREVVRLFRARIVEKGLHLTVEEPAQRGMRVVGDGMRLRQIVANLVSNAVKFTDLGDVTLRLSVTPIDPGRAMVRCEVEDTGIGISEEDLSRLFQPFTQAGARSKGGERGSGLGLVICRKLAVLMEGRIDVVSELGRGSKFTLTLPLNLAAGAADAEAPEQPSPELPVAKARARVLVVEDNVVNRKLVERMLEKLGCAVVVAEGGSQALELASKQEFDLVLMDWQMPEMDGLEVTRRLKQLWPVTRQVPVVALTASAMEGDRAACLEAGMCDYLTKPLRMAMLADVLERWSGLAAAQAGGPN